jgi:2-hydroxy-6-oxonona-2,4-dienedioate hydrolase
LLAWKENEISITDRKKERMAVSSPVFESVWSDLQGVPFSQGYLDAGGVRTRYLHAGDTSKPTLVLLHGSGGHAEAYVRNL